MMIKHMSKSLMAMIVMNKSKIRVPKEIIQKKFKWKKKIFLKIVVKMENIKKMILKLIN